MTGVPAIAFSDKVVQQGGSYAYLNGTTWAGIPNIIPGKAYWIVNKHPGNVWTYTYDGAAAVAAVNAPEQRDGFITSVKDAYTAKKQNENANAAVKNSPKSAKAKSNSKSK
jgi:hypothetical protein